VENVADAHNLFVEALQLVAAQKEVKRLMVIPNAEDADIYNKVREALRSVDEEKHVTVFAMQPMTGGNFRQEILGYSLMAALGIKAEEINSK
jgi:3-deoxy-D-arabino-heptulosonate 7-phosphate (DAHP) synthase class II